MSPATLFGVPLHLDADARDRLINMISRSWSQQMGRPPRALSADLQDLRGLFGTGASPKKLRLLIQSMVPAGEEEAQGLPEEVALLVDGCTLITPEGRILLDVLIGLRTADATRIQPSQQIRAFETATTLRAQWHAEWLRKQFDASLSASVLGAALFLLINGSVGERQALRLPGDDRQDRELGSLVQSVVAPFSTTLGGKEPDLSSGLRQHWAFSQLSRLLSRRIARTSDGEDGAIYIRAGQEILLLDDLRRRLKRFEEHRRRRAVMQLVENYRAARGVLAALGQTHEDPTTTRRIVARLTDPIGPIGPIGSVIAGDLVTNA